MATYKVPSDLDVDDKVIGFLSLKQFVFVLIDAGFLFLAYRLYFINILFIIPLIPFIFIFSVLGFYKRSDQPVEVFLVSWLKFKTSPKIRRWKPQEFEKIVEIDKPPEEKYDFSKGMTSSSARSRLDRIAGQLDNNSWNIKQSQGISPSSSGYNAGDERILSAEETASISSKQEESWQKIISSAKDSTTTRFDNSMDTINNTYPADDSINNLNPDTPSETPKISTDEVDLNSETELKL